MGRQHQGCRLAFRQEDGTFGFQGNPGDGKEKIERTFHLLLQGNRLQQNSQQRG
jgi:hypothetical protein